MTERKERKTQREEVYIGWFAFSLSARARAGADQSQEPESRNSSGSPTWVTGTKPLGHHELAPRHTNRKQGGEGMDAETSVTKHCNAKIRCPRRHLTHGATIPSPAKNGRWDGKAEGTSQRL